MAELAMPDLVTRLKNLVNEEFQKQKLDMASLMAILFALGQAQTTGELIGTAKAFADRFPVIDGFLSEVSAQEKQSMEKDVQAIIQKMVARDPMKAAQIAKDAMQPGATFDALAAKYPEIKNF
ncbi:MAG: hypothetical protein UT33_C0009G0073 [Candidatus Peregrinibacteria bacterium GW2011_GWC2_39_14]|nr:MAG: hypothetical protein US92_C0005G0073 [Candidatus Peregrinibacteria bacterium GW2011_GWA2_38_36]KKR06622.1 MAG: hypothetical protein UT33_C0009G0073 [Candidatus Peregrinibacteria bacterium GW2011_GWC2_39_14]